MKMEPDPFESEKKQATNNHSQPACEILMQLGNYSTFVTPGTGTG